MTVILVGLNHRTTPVEVREKLALSGEDLQAALKKLREGCCDPDIDDPEDTPSIIQEGVIISTCNRLEVYAVVTDVKRGWDYIDQFLENLPEFPTHDLQPYLYHYDGTEAIRHIMCVASGLDSMILGEPQILGQVSRAFQNAQSIGLTGAILSRLFSQAIHAGKRARSETDISRYTTSVSHVGALMVRDHVTVTNPHVLIVGAGEMAVLVAQALQDHHVTTRMSFINRTHSRAVNLAAEFDGDVCYWHQLIPALARADVVVTATGAPHPILSSDDVAFILNQRQDRPLLFVDLAVPRDVEESVGQLPGVQCFDIDDLQSTIDINANQRKATIPQVEQIVKQELNTYIEWYRIREVVPVIRDLREWAQDVQQSEVELALNKLQDADDQTIEVVNWLAHRLVNKMLHQPTVRLRGHAADGNGYGYAHVLSDLFGLEFDDEKRELSRISCDLTCVAASQYAQHHRENHNSHDVENKEDDVISVNI